jgi:phenylacetate-CoA ligase
MSTSTQAPATGGVNRNELSRNGFAANKTTGLLAIDPTAEYAFPLASDDAEAALVLAAETLTAAGLRERDRVVVALNNDGDLGGTTYATAAARVASAAASSGPRGRMRLLRTIEHLRANVLIGTPTGVADFLARLHLEFLVDPLDLELRLILLTGEISEPGNREHLAREFGAQCVELFTDPVSGLPLGYQGSSDNTITPTRDGLLTLIELESAPTDGRFELVVGYPWHSALSTTRVRTGYLTDSDVVSMPTNTYGDHILIRGRWLSLKALTKALKAIDGIAHWELRVARRGTLDSATLVVAFNRESLVNNGMWHSRIRQSLTTLTPISINVEIDPVVRESTEPPSIRDDRGHHVHF